MFDLNEPSWMLLLLSFPILIWLRFFWLKRGGRIVFPYRIWKGDGFRSSNSALTLFSFITNAIFWLGVVTLIMALSGPVITERKEVHLSRGIDIMIILDQSPSMGVEDFPPINRFNIARDMIRSFVSRRKGDSIGLVSFASVAVLQCPPTADYKWLLHRLDELELRELGDGTAMGMGLATATLHLTDSKAEEKVILLLTDGDDNAGEIHAETVASLAAENGIRIYAMGIGSEGENLIEIMDSETGVLTRGTIVTHFDEEKLRSLAEETGGAYWKAMSPRALEAVFKAVDALETVERRVSIRVVSRPIHRPFIIIGGLAIVLVYFIRKVLMGSSP